MAMLLESAMDGSRAGAGPGLPAARRLGLFGKNRSGDTELSNPRNLLLGGLEHVFFLHILGIIIPTDQYLSVLFSPFGWGESSQLT